MVNPQFLPPASEVLVQFFSNLVLGAFWVAVGQTMLGWASGSPLPRRSGHPGAGHRFKQLPAQGNQLHR